MKRQSEVWSGAHGFSLAVSPASTTQQAMTEAGGADVSGGVCFGEKKPVDRGNFSPAGERILKSFSRKKKIQSFALH